jgi:hypothetical protein
MVGAAMVLLLYTVQLIGHTSYSDCEESCSKTVSIFPRLTNNLEQRGCWKARLPRGKIFVPDGQLVALYGATTRRHFRFANNLILALRKGFPCTKNVSNTGVSSSRRRKNGAGVSSRRGKCSSDGVIWI